jgi:hypothetical protein
VTQSAVSIQLKRSNGRQSSFAPSAQLAREITLLSILWRQNSRGFFAVHDQMKVITHLSVARRRTAKRHAANSSGEDADDKDVSPTNAN